METAPITIGLIGLDTSHAQAFTAILNDASAEHHVPGGRITHGFPGGSPDFPLSQSRVEGFTETLRDTYGITISDSPEAVAEACDAIMITAADGREHLRLFQGIAGCGKPVFIDKPLADNAANARAIAGLSREAGAPVFSASSLRFTEPMVHLLEACGGLPAVRGADIAGPLPIEPTQGRYFWYGIHSAEALFAAMGTGCKSVAATVSEDHDLLVGRWEDGRMGVIRGMRGGDAYFQATLHGDGCCETASLLDGPRPLYHGLLQQVLTFFRTRESPVSAEEMREVIAFLECADQSARFGDPVFLPA